MILKLTTTERCIEQRLALEKIKNLSGLAYNFVVDPDLNNFTCIHPSLFREMESNPEILAARAKLMAKFGDASRVGGKGTIRRSKRPAQKVSGTDDKKLQGTFKKLGCHPIPAIEEVNMFMEDGNVIHFVNPRMQASIPANVFVVSGHSETKPLQDLLPGIAPQLGAENLMALKKIAEQAFAAQAVNKEGDDVPDLVEGANFEEVSKQ
jgi:nascent polypeptide-associated complex subunit beta